MPRDYYEVLGVGRDATEDQIKKAHRTLARKFHPDRNPGDKQAETNFKEVQDAYDILSDKSKREQFDRFGFAGPQQGPGGGGSFHWGGGAPANGDFNVDPEIFSQIFGNMGGGGINLDEVLGGRQAGRRSGRSRARAQPQAAPPVDVAVPFETAVQGGTITLRVGDKTIDLKVPAGTEDGKVMRLAGQAPGGADLHLRLRVEPHPHFRREGNGLVLTVPLALAEAALGAKIDVPTVSGSKLSVKVPPGTSSGSRLRLRGFGVNGGDQYLEFKVVVPAKLDEPSRKLLEEFAKLNPQEPRSGPPWN